MADTAPSRIATWSSLLLATLLVTLVGGAFWLKTRPKLAGSSDPARLESAQTLLARGIREHNAGNFDAAMELYHKILQRDPAEVHAHYNLGQIYNERRQYAQAQWEYEATLKANPQALDARINLGLVLYRQRQFAAAEAFRQVLQTAPRYSTALYDLGITLLDMGQAKEASRWLAAAVRENPKWVDAHYYLGVALERQRRLPEAKAALQKALALNPGHAQAYAVLSRVYLAQGERNLAREALTKAVALNPRVKP